MVYVRFIKAGGTVNGLLCVIIIVLLFLFFRQLRIVAIYILYVYVEAVCHAFSIYQRSDLVCVWVSKGHSFSVTVFASSVNYE